MNEISSVLDSAASLDWRSIDYFSASEFPIGVLEHLEADYVVELSEYRHRLGHPISPSPLSDGWFRLDGSEISRHYAVGRLSDAGDLFPHCDIRDALMVALGCEWWGGIGVYLDTHGPTGKPQPMLHLDRRAKRVIWMRYEGRYIYPQNSAEERKEFWQRLGEL